MNAPQVLTMDDVITAYNQAIRPRVVVNANVPGDNVYFFSGPHAPTIVVRTTDAADRVEAALDEKLPGSARNEGANR